MVMTSRRRERDAQAPMNPSASKDAKFPKNHWSEFSNVPDLSIFGNSVATFNG